MNLLGKVGNTGFALFHSYSDFMYRFMLKSKIHRAKVTDANLNYEGSLTLDEALMEAADLLPFENVHIWNVTQGTRLQTYLMVGKRDSGTVCINGAAAHLVHPGDIVIIASFTMLDDVPAKTYKPEIVFVDDQNRQVKN